MSPLILLSDNVTFRIDWTIFCTVLLALIVGWLLLWLLGVIRSRNNP